MGLKSERMRRCLTVIAVVAGLLAIASPIFMTQQPVSRRGGARPEIRPTIPDADRANTSEVFMEHAEKLYARPGTDYQVLTGDVRFRRGGMMMYCDSAHFYEKTGFFNAYGNVRMEQGDTLFVYADSLNYFIENQIDTLVVLYAFPGKEVRLINRDVELHTPEFYYNLHTELGYYLDGGELFDSKNRLTSLEGEYNVTTKEALFRNAVHLVARSEKDTLEIFTEDLYYNTTTHVAEMYDNSVIINADGVIYTSEGIYNTDTEQSELYNPTDDPEGRPLVESKNGNTIMGDTLLFDRQTGIGRAFGNIEIRDTTNKITATGEYGFYNQLTDSTLITGRARVMEYSQADTLWLHGDTIRLYRRIILPEVAAPQPESPDSVAPTAENIENIESVESIEGPEISESIEEIESIEVSEPEVNMPEISMPEVKSREPIEAAATADTIRYIVASPRVKFYRNDIQGVCDSLTFVSADSIIHMNYFPVIWSENRQVTGSLIDVHLNDSTVESAYIPTNSFVAECIEEGYYNQLSGKELKALFDDGKLRHLDVSGNVRAIVFQEEKDSTINKLMTVESSYLAADFKDNAIDRLKMWPQTNAVVVPLYLANQADMFLPDFVWFEDLRPSSPDDIFNFSKELLAKFRAAGGPSKSSDPEAEQAKTAEPSDESDESDAQPQTDLIKPDNNAIKDDNTDEHEPDNGAEEVS